MNLTKSIFSHQHDDYKTVAELNGLAKKCSYIYVSESKNGKQYLGL